MNKHISSNFLKNFSKNLQKNSPKIQINHPKIKISISLMFPATLLGRNIPNSTNLAQK